MTLCQEYTTESEQHNPVQEATRGQPRSRFWCCRVVPTRWLLHTHLIALKRWQLFRRPTLQHFNWCKTPNWLNALIWEGHTGLFQQTLGMLLLIYSPIHPTYYTPEWMQKYYKTNAACFGNKVHAIPRYKNRKSTLRKTFVYWRFSQLSKNTCKKTISIEA